MQGTLQIISSVPGYHMKTYVLIALAGMIVAKRSDAQSNVRIRGEAGGEVTRAWHARAARLAPRIPGLDSSLRARVQISGDSAQRIAMNDFEWRGRVTSVEVDEEDARVFWDVKIAPDSSDQTLVRYRVDAVNGGILGIREFTGIRGLVRRP